MKTAPCAFLWSRPLRTPPSPPTTKTRRPRASPATNPSWEFAVTAYPTVVRGGENYTSAIAIADRGALHLEARYNYESIGARSAFVGWNFSGGEAITWD